MNSVLEIIKKRRSIRKYSLTSVEYEKIIKMVEAARLAPSASNRQPWRFIAVTDKNLVKLVVNETLGVINRWAITAPLIIVGCTVRSNIITHYLGEIISKVKYYIIDISIAMEHIVFEAEELGLSTCWVGWFNERKMKKILNIPSMWSVTAVLTVGYADPEYSPKPQKRHSIEKILILK